MHAKRPCTTRATQRASARFVKAPTACRIRSTLPSTRRSHHSTSWHATEEYGQLAHAIAMASHTKCGVSDHEHKSSCGAAVRRRHQRGSSWQLTTATTSSTSACQCTPSSMAAGSSISSTTTNAATMDGRFRWLTKWTFVGALSTLPSASPMESGHRNYNRLVV